MFNKKIFSKITYLLLSFYTLGFSQNQFDVGAEQINKYFSIIKDKNVGIVANQSSIIFNKGKQVHIVDTLISIGVNVTKVFAPEHGFRGNKDNGELVKDEIDSKTNLKIISLHGKNRKPTKINLEKIDFILFDIQDVGVRFYTYLSTLHYIMEACAENGIKLIVLDRPNPNIYYIDGPVMEDENKSFLGMHPVPIVYGMTIGEYALMINGEKWLKNEIKTDLLIIPISNYNHSSRYNLPIRPSPNLPNSKSINLYPSLCLLEQTPISIGRGTEMQFQIYGHPKFSETKFRFTPKPNFGSKNPKLKNRICNGYDLRQNKELSKIELKWLIKSYRNFPFKEEFFNSNFAKISGTKTLEHQIKKGFSITEIRKSWSKKIENFKLVRQKYLIYK